MSLTTNVCLSLLLSGGPAMGPASPAEQTAVREWLQSLNIVAPSPEQISEILKQWQVWRTTTASARAANLALELKNISPSEQQNVFSLNRRADLKTLSATNLERLKEQISERLPLNTEPAASVLVQVKSMSEDISLHYLRPYRMKSETGVNEPLASSRELAKLKIDFAPTYYSTLVGKSSSVGFVIIAAKKHGSPYSLNAQVPFTALRLNDELAREEGFVVPNFSSPNGLLAFFRNWEPVLLEKLFRQNRMSLPSGVDSVEKFLVFLDPQKIKEVFPDQSAFNRLAILRESLSRFALTESDARGLLHWAFERWLVSVAVSDQLQFGRILEEFSLAAGPQAVFTKKFLPQLGMPDLALRLPLAVGPQSYSILRIENLAYDPFPERGVFRQKAWDSRRLDHDSKP